MLDDRTVYVRLLTPRRLAEKFVIFGQGRSGSSLLVDLLNSSPQVYCEGEILERKVPFPHYFVAARANRSPKPIFGFKVKVYQLTKKQGVMEPRRFLQRMVGDGWNLIYLKRTNILRHAMSSVVAAHRGASHHEVSQGPLRLKKFYVETSDLIRRIKKRERLLQEEALILHDLPYFSVHYETDLLRSECHQDVTNRLFDYLNIARAPVKTKLMRTGKDDLSDIIKNYDEVVQVLAENEYAGYLGANWASQSRKL
ncbi:MAG: hypothetical protein H0V62_07335 [Gammaproteobacteria bacterium]|nr:hypothetical protein [Gammaproteobacteria bacterium]